MIRPDVIIDRTFSNRSILQTKFIMMTRCRGEKKNTTPCQVRQNKLKMTRGNQVSRFLRITSSLNLLFSIKTVVGNTPHVISIRQMKYDASRSDPMKLSLFGEMLD